MNQNRTIPTTMSKKQKGEYTYSYNPSTNMVTKTDTANGNTWVYASRPKIVKEPAEARNGVTVDKLIAAGHNVRVKHLRYALYWGQSFLRKNRSSNSTRVMVVPSTFRHDPEYFLLPKGGFTHIVIKRPSGEYTCVSSECSPEDPFCYNTGVCAALERLTGRDLIALGLADWVEMSEYLQKLAEVEKLIAKMDLPAYRKNVKHNDDARWLKNNLSVRNEKHKNYARVMELLASLV